MRAIYITLNIIIALIWIINGLVCKVLNVVPRHEQIVAKILSNEHAHMITWIIGVLEIFMGLWIISNIQHRLSSILQIIIVLMMNLLEFYLAPDLLLFGKLNLVFAIFLCATVFYKEFYLIKSAQKITGTNRN